MTGSVNDSSPKGHAATLVADCARCVGLCCVALAFARSADFAFDKAAGDPCVNLEDDFRCGIHPMLRDHGFAGCTVFDCHGAGQKVTITTFGGRSWREDADLRDRMFAVFPIVRTLHEMLWYLHTVDARVETRPIAGQLHGMYRHVEQLTVGTAQEILALDVDAVRDRVNAVLSEASRLVRAGARDAQQPAQSTGTPAALPSDKPAPQPSLARPARLPKRIRSGADLVGANLSGHDLRGADLRGAVLIGADLSNADLRRADLIAADLRSCDLRGADLSETIFLTQMQINAATGDSATRLPEGVRRPFHWAK